MQTFITLLTMLLVASAVYADDLRISIPDRDDLVLSIPAGWKTEVHSSRPDLPPTIGMTSGKQNEVMILITPAWPASAAAGPPGAEEIRKLVQDAADAVKSRAVESTLPLNELDAPGMLGFYVTATDREPEPDGFKYLTQGAIGFGELRVTFTILLNGEPKVVTEQALQVLRNMRRAPPGTTLSLDDARHPAGQIPARVDNPAGA